MPGPATGLVTIDVDATFMNTYGVTKQGSAVHYSHEIGLSPLIGVCGETGDVAEGFVFWKPGGLGLAGSGVSVGYSTPMRPRWIASMSSVGAKRTS